MIVVDASVVVSALVDGGATGRWAEGVLRRDTLVSPAILPAEVTNILRRAERAGQVSADVASQAFVDLCRLPVRRASFDAVAERVWELRANLTAYDGWYVACAEAADAPLATLDARIAGAPGLRCEVLLPP